MRKSLLILVIFSIFFVSCSKKVVKPLDNPGSLYVEGVEQLDKKKYDKAIADFAKIRESFPFDPIAIVAQIKQGDAYFAKKDYQLAASTYEDFVNSYPDDENGAYALKRLAESYERQSPTLDRDQAITVKAIERYTFLKNRYPTSPYAKDAETHVKILTQKLGARELYVGEFYHRSGDYNASILRLEYFLQAYPEANDRDKALHYLAEDYRELNRPDKAQYYLDRLRIEYPKSVYVKGPTPKKRKTVQTLATDATPASPATPDAAVSPVSLAAAASSETPAAAPSPAALAAAAAPASDRELAPAAAASPAAPAAALSYEETEKREIDLRPPEPAAPSKDENGEARDGVTSPESKGEESGKQAIPASDAAVSGSDEGQSSGEGAKAEKPASKHESLAKVETGSKPRDAEAETKDEDKKETAKSGEKKNGLGFFTEKKPVDVVADTMEAFEKGKTIVFTGHVIAKQEGSEPGQTLFLFSDKLTAYRTDESSDIQKAEAEGNVKVVKAQRTATCKQAFFYNDKGEVVLKGDVVVFEGNDRLTGDTATYYLNEDRVYVQGDNDKRARVIVTPK
jgi:outer membrane protein assembly factor BamD